MFAVCGGAPMASHPDSIRGGRRASLHIYIALLFGLLIVGVAGVITWRNYVENRQLIVSASHELVQAIGGKAVAAFTSIYQPVELVIDLLAREPLGQAKNLTER